MILAIDPGGTTGIAIRMNDGSIQTCVCQTMTGDKKKEFDSTSLYDMICTPGITHVVYEMFQAELISKYGLHTVRLVGAIEALCWKLNIPVLAHMPQMRRPFLDEAKKILTKKGGRYVIHEVDALAHLLRMEYDREHNNG